MDNKCPSFPSELSRWVRGDQEAGLWAWSSGSAALKVCFQALGPRGAGEESRPLLRETEDRGSAHARAVLSRA